MTGEPISRAGDLLQHDLEGEREVCNDGKPNTNDEAFDLARYVHLLLGAGILARYGSSFPLAQPLCPALP